MPTNTATVTAGTYANTAVTWTIWNQAITSATNASTVTWTGWNQTATSVTCDIWPSWQQAARPVSEAEAQALLRNQQAARDRFLAAEGERAKARERAELLLRESLDDEQKAQLAADGFFRLATVAPNGERRLYRIRRGRSRNIQQVDESGRVLKHLCAHPAEQVPDADTMLAQKLWLETREEEFLRIANHS